MNKTDKPKTKIYIDYPNTRRGNQLSGTFSFVTYLSVIFVVFSSYIKFGDPLFWFVVGFEIIFSFFFLLDFLIRWFLSKFSPRFLFNFYTILDIISILPLFLISFMGSTNFVEILIIFRLWRVLRIFKMSQHVYFLKKFWRAVKKNEYRYKLGGIIFLIILLIWSFIMYWLESQVNPDFATIPHAIRWMATKLFMIWYTSWTPITPTGTFVWSVLLFIWPVFISILTWTIIVTFLDVVKIMNENNDEKFICEHCLTPYNKLTDVYCKICGKKHP